MEASTPGGARGGRRFQTTCGRDVTVGLIAVGDTRRPARRVTVDIGECPGCHDGAWAALTPAEARQLAISLLAQADAAERGTRGRDPSPGKSRQPRGPASRQ
jgi:hypothetical protein